MTRSGEQRIAEAARLMAAYAERTGASSARPQRRYLWTDAFAVCNFLALARATGDDRHRELAFALVDRVHRTLGRHRGDDDRAGWISGLDEATGARHPTAGGLRIGKPLPERPRGEPTDDPLEWERDGQYFHYLTRWMHALDQVSRDGGDPRYSAWARELAVAAHRGFVYPGPGGAPRMVWKTSIDLTRPVVASMGHHDPLDGLVTALQLEATASMLGTLAAGPALDRAAADYAAMIDPGQLATADSLGLGGLLVDAYRLAQLGARSAVVPPGLLEAVLASAVVGLRHWSGRGELRAPAAHRLAFRELGLAIGLAAVDALARRPELEPGPDARLAVDHLARLAPLRAELEGFWLHPDHRRTRSWQDHADINDVMLATSLVPDGYLELRALRVT